jgi:hypothetical protein
MSESRSADHRHARVGFAGLNDRKNLERVDLFKGNWDKLRRSANSEEVIDRCFDSAECGWNDPTQTPPSLRLYLGGT